MSRENTASKIALHRRAVHNAYLRLREIGLRCRIMPETHSKFDLLIEGCCRVEVKAAEKIQQKAWKFNLHRHGVVADGAVDFFVLYLPPLQWFNSRYGIPLVVPAALAGTRKGIYISARSLATTWGRFHGRYRDIADFCCARRRSALNRDAEICSAVAQESPGREAA